MLDRGARIVELFKQIQYNPLAIEIRFPSSGRCKMATSTMCPWTRSRTSSSSLQDYLATRKEAFLGKIRDKGQIDEDIDGDLKSAVSDFKTSYV